MHHKVQNSLSFPWLRVNAVQLDTDERHSSANTALGVEWAPGAMWKRGCEDKIFTGPELLYPLEFLRLLLGIHFLLAKKEYLSIFIGLKLLRSPYDPLIFDSQLHFHTSCRN